MKATGKLLKTESDALKIKNQRRAKLRSVANNTRHEWEATTDIQASSWQ